MIFEADWEKMLASQTLSAEPKMEFCSQQKWAQWWDLELPFDWSDK